jgi:predicted dehydrogenase
MHAWSDIDGVNIVAICDKDPDRLQIVGDQFGISRRYADARAMLADVTLDFVDIATTVNSHLPLVTLAAEHELAVICQKPFALTVAEAKKMVAACSEAGVALMVHENFRWQSPIQCVRSIIDSGEIGTPFWGRFSFRSAFDVFSGQPYLAEGKRFIIEDLGIHTLDIARFLMGEVQALTARTSRINATIQGEDVATMLLAHEAGATSVVDCSYATKLSMEPFPETIVEIDGSIGTIRLQQGYRMEVVGRNQARQIDVSPMLLPWATRPWHNIQESVYAIQQHWTECLRSGQQPSTSGADNLKTLALVEAAYRSAEQGATVLLQDLLR